MSVGVSNCGKSINREECEEKGCSAGNFLPVADFAMFSLFGAGTLEQRAIEDIFTDRNAQSKLDTRVVSTQRHDMARHGYQTLS